MRLPQASLTVSITAEGPAPGQTVAPTGTLWLKPSVPGQAELAVAHEAVATVLPEAWPEAHGLLLSVRGDGPQSGRQRRSGNPAPRVPFS